MIILNKHLPLHWQSKKKQNQMRIEKNSSALYHLFITPLRTKKETFLTDGRMNKDLERLFK